MPGGNRSNSSKKTQPATGKKAPKALEPKQKKSKPRQYKLSKPMKESLDAYMDRDTEDHWVINQIPQQNLPCEPQSGVGGMYRILPPVVQAGIPTVGDPMGIPATLATRTGAQIKLKKMNCHILLRLNPSYSDNRATGVWYRVLVCSCKNLVDYNQFVTDYYAAPAGLRDSIFKEAATPVGYTPSIVDISNPVNRQLFTVHVEKQGFLSKGQIISPTQNGKCFALHAFKELNLKLKVKSKILKYNNPGDTVPTNFQPFIMFFWKDMDSFDYRGIVPPPAYVEVSAKTHMSFDDLA